MISAAILIGLLEGVSSAHAAVLEPMFAELKREGSGAVVIQLSANGDLNADGVEDSVYVFMFAMGPNRDHTHTQYLTCVSSQGDGSFAASWPSTVGARGYRVIRSIAIDDQTVTLRGQFTTSDGTATMADLPADGEIVYRFADGKLIEQRGSWQRREE
ncbi:MAG: hypothetical protein QNJ00_17010 [Woeseiaceae bacterium]|nr:hypothetical protein [Woeseiaceae bacterium]